MPVPLTKTDNPGDRGRLEPAPILLSHGAPVVKAISILSASTDIAHHAALEEGSGGQGQGGWQGASEVEERAAQPTPGAVARSLRTAPARTSATTPAPRNDSARARRPQPRQFVGIQDYGFAPIPTWSTASLPTHD